jgi:hypothetical protein
VPGRDIVFGAIRKPIDKVTDDFVRSLKKGIEQINQLEGDDKIDFSITGVVDMDGKFKITKDGKIAFAGAVSGTIPTSGPPVDAEAGVDFDKEWTASNSGKLRIDWSIRFEMTRNSP